VLEGVDGDVVGFDGVGDGGDRAFWGVDGFGEVVDHPVGDVLDAVLGEEVERFVGLGEAGAFPTSRRHSPKARDSVNRVPDGTFLVV